MSGPPWDRFQWFDSFKNQSVWRICIDIFVQLDGFFQVDDPTCEDVLAQSQTRMKAPSGFCLILVTGLTNDDDPKDNMIFD